MPGSRPSRIRRVFIFLKTCYNELMKNIVQKKYIIKKARPILKKSGVKKAALFGSAARGDMTRKSDIDFVIDIDKNKSFLDVVGLKIDLEDVLGRKVDLVEYGVIKPRFKKSIFKDQVPVL